MRAGRCASVVDRARRAAAGGDRVAVDRTDFGEQRKTTTSATSRASTRWRIELPSAICCSTASSLVPCAAARACTSAAVRSVRVRPGWTTVTLMPCGPELVGEVLGQRRDRDVADAADGVAGLARGQAAEVDDAAPALRLHVRRDRARAAQVAHDLDVDLALQVRGVDLGERRRRRVAARLGRGVDEDVDAAAERGDRLGDRALDLRLVARCRRRRRRPSRRSRWRARAAVAASRSRVAREQRHRGALEREARARSPCRCRGCRR